MCKERKKKLTDFLHNKSITYSKSSLNSAQNYTTENKELHTDGKKYQHRKQAVYTVKRIHNRINRKRDAINTAAHSPTHRHTTPPLARLFRRHTPGK